MHPICELFRILFVIRILFFFTLFSPNLGAADWRTRPLDALSSVKGIIQSYDPLQLKSIDETLPDLTATLEAADLSFQSSPSAEKIRIGVGFYQLGKYFEHYRFLDGKDGTWIDIVTLPTSEALATFWNSLRGSQWYMGERDWNYWVFSTTRSETDNSVNLVFCGEKGLFNVGASLSFSTSSTSFVPSDAEM